MLNHKEINNLKHYFELLDKDGTGMITRQELREALKQVNKSLSNSDID